MRQHLGPIDPDEFAQVSTSMRGADGELFTGDKLLPDDVYEREEIAAAFKRSYDAVNE